MVVLRRDSAPPKSEIHEVLSTCLAWR